MVPVCLDDNDLVKSLATMAFQHRTSTDAYNTNLRFSDLEFYYVLWIKGEDYIINIWETQFFLYHQFENIF